MPDVTGKSIHGMRMLRHLSLWSPVHLNGPEGLLTEANAVNQQMHIRRDFIYGNGQKNISSCRSRTLATNALFHLWCSKMLKQIG